MRKSILILGSLAVTALLSAGATPQATTKHYEKGGFSFDYPSNWTLTESAKPQAVDISLRPGSVDLQINIYLREEVFNSPEMVEDAKTKLIEPHIAGSTQQMKSWGLKPNRTDGTSTMGGQPAQLSNIKADLDGAQGGNEVHWAFLHDRLIIFTTFGADADVKKLSKQLDALRNSFAIKAGDQASSPASPSPTPKP